MTKRPPTLRQRRLALRLRQLREDAGLSQEAVADLTGIARSTIIGVEAGRRSPQRRTLLALLDLYEAYGEERDELLALLVSATETEWLRLARDELPAPYAAYIDFERNARVIRSYQPLLIPGLVQTAGYARAQARAALPDATAEEIGTRVNARIERQVSFAAGDAHLFAVITEAALWCEVGGPDVHRAQLLALVDVFESRNITLRVIPSQNGEHPSMMASFSILDFDDDYPSVVYAENAGGAVFLEDAAELLHFRDIHRRIEGVALDPSSSHRLIAETIRKIYERHPDDDSRQVVQELPFRGEW